MNLAIILAAVAAQAGATVDDRRQLAAELQADVRQYRAGLPIREGLLTISAVNVVGTDVIYTGSVDAQANDATIETFRQALARNLCAVESANTRSAILRGASFTYDLRDSGGQRFVSTVNHCD